MPWQEVTSMSQRRDFIAQAIQPQANISQLCRDFGISRKTGYKWLKRYQQAGVDGLHERWRRPQQCPHQTPAAIETRVVATRQQFPTWGARKLKAYLAGQGHSALPSLSTITAILRRHGLLEPSASAQHRPYQRFEMAQPNQLWQMDFKGHFACADGTRCHPLTLLDDHARYLLGLFACANEQHATVQQHLIGVFRQYGLPERMLMDNGAPWGDDADTPYTRLGVWLLHLGVAISHGRAYHPQTQGKVERIHRTLNEDVLQRTCPAHLPASQQCFDAWRPIYNTLRPHEALAMCTPHQRYTASPRPYPETLPAIDYPSSYQVRKVQQGGRISFRNRTWRVGKAFTGYPVGLQPDPLQDGVFAVYFCQTRIRSLDFRSR